MLYARTMAAPPILTLRAVSLRIGTTPLLDNVELSVLPGDRLALVGRNGAGKSTLMKVAAGTIVPEDGSRFVQPGATIRYLQQEPDLAGYATVLDYVEAGLEAGDAAHRGPMLLDALGLSPDADPRTLSGGEARRAALARVLAPEPDILLLDEPTNHLDLPAIEWLETELAGLRSAIVMVSHDRRLLADLSRATVWLDRGSVRRLDRGFAEFEAWRDAELEAEETARHKLERKIVREEHWLTYGVTARRKRNVRRLEGLRSLRTERRSAKPRQGNVNFSVTEAESSGKLVIDADAVVKRFGDRTIVDGVSLRVLRGDRVGIVGANGTGKTTLLKLLTGDLAPDAGRVRVGANVVLATLDQRRAALDPETPLRDALTGGGSDSVLVNGESRHVMSYMQDFLFTPEQAGTPVGRLSGGERGRLALARLLALPSNLLVLDEPTNDLDLETLDLLEEMVGDYPGTVIVVSHDRDFLDRVATSVVVSEGNGRWVEYAGGYSDMVAQRGHGVRPPDRPVERSAPKPSVPRPAPARQAKLSFKDKHALETLPAEIARLEAELARLNGVLADSSLYSRNPDGFAAATAGLASATEALRAAEDRWLELEMLREELES